MDILGRLFGSDKAISDITDKDNGLLTQVGGWVGGFHHTDQEKAEDNQKTREWGLKQLEALEPFKVVQRIMVFIIFSMWALTGICCLVSFFLEAFINMPISATVGGIETITKNNLTLVAPLLKFAFSDFILWPVAGCVSLYLGGGVVESFKRKPSK
jgi:hypothetical protein